MGPTPQFTKSCSVVTMVRTRNFPQSIVTVRNSYSGSYATSSINSSPGPDRSKRRQRSEQQRSHRRKRPEPNGIIASAPIES